MFAKRAERHDREASFPYDDFADLREAGFLALCVPTSVGWSRGQLRRLLPGEQRARSSRAGDRARVQHALRDDAARRSDRRRPDVDRRRSAPSSTLAGTCLYAGVVDRGTLHSQPFSEGNAPGATEGIPTLAEPVDGGYLVTGRKIFASLSEAANIHNIVARSPGDERVRFLGVPAVADGLSIVGEWDPLGMRATLSRTLVFDRVFVPHRQRVAAARRLRSGCDTLAALLHDAVVHLSRSAAWCARRDAVVPPAFGSRRPSDQAAGMGRAAAPLRAGREPCSTRPPTRPGVDPDAGSPSTGVGGGGHGDGRRGRDGVIGTPRRRRPGVAETRASRTPLPRRTVRRHDAAVERRGVPRTARSGSASSTRGAARMMPDMHLVGDVRRPVRRVCGHPGEVAVVLCERASRRELVDTAIAALTHSARIRRWWRSDAGGELTSAGAVDRSIRTRWLATVPRSRRVRAPASSSTAPSRDCSTRPSWGRSSPAGRGC